ncbi:MAG: efflux RND transporter periplasmic adaptor subunit [Firmicutes bacterium]|nr:efflux RND transporter periplasmic adaptor subunit [Bacillota bacterium]
MNQIMTVFLKKIGLLFFTILFFSAFFSSCAKSGTTSSQPQKKARTVLIKAAPVLQKTIPQILSAIGTVQAISTISVQPQVTGKLAEVYFKEGDLVKKGELLFKIDPRPFQIALNQSRANLEKDEAALKQAEANLQRDKAQEKYNLVEAERYKILLGENYTSKEQYDQMQTSALASKATVLADQAAVQTAKKADQADQAAVQNAELNLSYCFIHSPITGKTGAILIRPGNLVTAESSTLATLDQLQPIYVVFSVPEQNLNEIKKDMAALSLPVSALPSGSRKSAEGRLTFMSNTVNSSTGTIELRGTFQNKKELLWPGQFVNVKLTLRSIPAFVIPSQAVQYGQNGTFVFVVLSNHTVQVYPVVTGETYQGETVIEKGLKSGETVVTDGQLNLFPGAEVSLQK